MLTLMRRMPSRTKFPGLSPQGLCGLPSTAFLAQRTCQFDVTLEAKPGEGTTAYTRLMSVWEALFSQGLCLCACKAGLPEAECGLGQQRKIVMFK